MSRYEREPPSAAHGGAAVVGVGPVAPADEAVAAADDAVAAGTVPGPADGGPLFPHAAAASSTTTSARVRRTDARLYGVGRTLATMKSRDDVESYRVAGRLICGRSLLGIEPSGVAV